MRASTARPYKVAGNDHKYAHRMRISIQTACTSVILRPATKQAVRISTEATGRGRGVYTPNFLRQMLLSVSQKLGSNIPRLALMALVEIHSSRFVALLRMTQVRWCTVPRETPKRFAFCSQKRAICCTFSLVRLHKQHTVLFVTLRVTARTCVRSPAVRYVYAKPVGAINHLLRKMIARLNSVPPHCGSADCCRRWRQR